MAENKKKIIVYADWLVNFEDLTNEELGKLMRHFFEYVNDKNPVLEDRLLKIAWKPIQSTLKRDLKKWEDKSPERVEKARKAGLASAEARRIKKQLNSTNELKNELNSTKSTVSVSDSVSEIIDKSITYTKKEFLEDWNELRTKHLKKPSFLKAVYGEDSRNFEEITKHYSREDIRGALVGLFKQQKFPGDNTQMRTNPKHFLSHFNSYHGAFTSKDSNIYGKKEITKI